LRELLLDLRARDEYAYCMDNDFKTDVEVDALGLLCPLPVLRARKRLIAMDPGQVLCLRTDDPAAIIDVPHFCNEQGYDLLGNGETGGALRFYIRK